MLKNRRMALSIADVGWRSFLTMLTQKSEAYGTDFRLVNPRYTTQTCSQCGFRKTADVQGGKQTLSGDNIEKKHEIYHCYQCDLILDRDLNAAKNILQKGLTL